ncbi:D-lactaldehyde dehydrogenase [Coprinopsis cinerea AmutBmut pab1-1]|nr:D-lactaldehyde dehydrogenase [Coprinopsis cinerea AmutBmut pab1-1]
MPTVSPGSKVLVTGANGFIAIWVVRRLLEEGYSVRGTVRAASKASHLKDIFKSYGEKLEVVVVPDFTKEGAFDELIKGMDAIQHIASPGPANTDDLYEIVNPAVDGTLNLLNTALKHGSGLKRIVITSGAGAIIDTTSTEPRTFTEDDWNDGSVRDIEEKGNDVPVYEKYRASKVLAERAAWKFYNDHKNVIKWDLTVLNPVFVFGPPIHEIGASPMTLNSSMVHFWVNVISTDTPKTKEGLSFAASWVDVRDVAQGHVLALQKEAAGGERIILSEGSFVWQDWVDVANKFKSKRELPKGMPEIERVYKFQMDASKATRILGITYRSKEDTMKDLLEDFERRGW